MKTTKQQLFLLLIGGMSISSLFLTKIIYASVSTDVNAVINISVCGNDLAEGKEECDSSDLKGASCQTIGYTSGELTCDMSCSYNTNRCISPASTPPPTNQINPFQSPPEQGTISPTQTQQADISQITKKEQINKSYPHILTKYGADENGTIPKNMVYTSVKQWVTVWQMHRANIHIREETSTGDEQGIACDLNDDGVCDLVDLSVMLYYIHQ